MELSKEVVNKSVFVLELSEQELRHILMWGGQSSDGYETYYNLAELAEKYGVEE